MENTAAHRYGETPFPVRRAVSETGIETLRVAATVLRRVPRHRRREQRADARSSHPLQVADAFLADVRMPLFAFIAGYVYAEADR